MVYERKQVEDYRITPAMPVTDEFFEMLAALWADVPEEELARAPRSDEVDEHVYGARAPRA